MTEVAEAPAPEQVAAGAPMSEEEARELATQWANEQAARLTGRAQNDLAKKNGQANGGVAPRIGAPTTTDLGGAPYVAFDVVATSPITVRRPAPDLPAEQDHPAGDLSFLVAYIYTNPSPGPGLGRPGEHPARPSALADDGRPDQPDHRHHLEAGPERCLHQPGQGDHAGELPAAHRGPGPGRGPVADRGQRHRVRRHPGPAVRGVRDQLQRHRQRSGLPVQPALPAVRPFETAAVGTNCPTVTSSSS